MKQALAALLGAGLTSAACYSAGALLLDRLSLKLRRPERLPLAFVLGAACLHLAIFVVLTLQIAYWPVLVALLLAVIGLAVKAGSWRLSGEPAEPLPTRLKMVCAAVFAPFFVLSFFHALAPESSPDGAGYHLGFVAQYLREHGFQPITTNMYAALSAGVDLLFVPAFAIGRHSAGALVHFTFLVALALLVFAYGRRLSKPWAGAAAAFFVFASPVVGMDGSSAYIDAAVAAIVFSVFYLLEIWEESRDNSVLIAIGLLSGYAYAAKYTAFVIVVYAAGFILWRARSIRPLFEISAWAALMIAPWLIKNWIVYQNPIAPFANQIFRNPYFHISAIDGWAEYLRRYAMPDLRVLPLEVTLRGAKTQGLIGPVFLALPVALLSLRFRAGRRLLVAGAILMSTYFANIGARFLIPPLPFFAFALALAPGDAPGLVVCLMLFHALTSWPKVIEHYAEPGVWRMDKVLVTEALRMVPQDRYLSQVSPGYNVARMIDAYVPKGERVLGLTGIAQAYTPREVLVDYEAAYNNVLAEIVSHGWLAYFQPRMVDRFTFVEHTLRRIRIEQTSTGLPQQQWSVNELRLFDKGAELPRNPKWRLTAWPNPWEVQLAFDNSPATRWKPWERAVPGQYIQVDFGGDQQVDELRIARSWDFTPQIQLEMFDEPSRRWIGIAANATSMEARVDPQIRRYATRELALRGIHYLLMLDSFVGAYDFRADPEGWGLELVAAEYGCRLYRVLQ
ncbi:MAG: glycosyltransferase family 39 protein [Bryobacterales bacterium]|nr:glycosyltransferase family 39 protein [Bryobacterales bacterium]MBV9400843.1 glycosyltransferase family 39 protein [Bryobacterales bacterium]